MEKMTYVSVLDKVIAGEVLTSEEIDKVKALREQTAKKHSKSDKPTKKQREAAELNVALGEKVLSAMEVGKTYQTSELAELVSTDEAKVNTSKMVQVLKALGDRVVKGEESRKGKGKVTVYSVAVAEA